MRAAVHQKIHEQDAVFGKVFRFGIDDPKYPTRLTVLYRVGRFVMYVDFFRILENFQLLIPIHFAREMKGKTSNS